MQLVVICGVWELQYAMRKVINVPWKFKCSFKRVCMVSKCLQDLQHLQDSIFPSVKAREICTKDADLEEIIYNTTTDQGKIEWTSAMCLTKKEDGQLVAGNLYDLNIVSVV